MIKPEVLYQATFFDGEFFGYADFVERTDAGWVVSDAQLARQAKPKALLQLGAYADQIRQLDLPLATKVSLLLGNGQRVEFQTADVIPVFRERRTRLRHLLAEHRAEAGFGPLLGGAQHRVDLDAESSVRAIRSFVDVSSIDATDHQNVDVVVRRADLAGIPRGPRTEVRTCSAPEIWNSSAPTPSGLTATRSSRQSRRHRRLVRPQGWPRS